VKSKTIQPSAVLPPQETQGMRTDRDVEVWSELTSLIAENDHSTKHILELWPAYVRRIHLGRFLAHYELFKQVVDLPGCIVECGVFRGSSFFTWSKLMETFVPNDRSRKVFGFDSFSGLTDFDEKDGKMDAKHGKVVGGWSAHAVRNEVLKLVDITNKDNLISGIERCRLIEGNIKETIPKFVEENPGLRISLLYLDMDLYEPTKVALEYLYDRVVPGGIVAFDEYGLMPWEGESVAVEEFMKERGLKYKLKKFPFSTLPHGYFIKD
jgi:hypothetical protein